MCGQNHSVVYFQTGSCLDRVKDHLSDIDRLERIKRLL